jgi:NAD(P)-dependent dehydrogenase (short-subunit alcohol dehydrogenase family)
MRADVSTRPVALVTGASRGIGRVCAVALAGSGFDILASGRDGPEDRALLDRLGGELAAIGAASLPFTAMAEGRLPYTVGQAVLAGGGLTIPRF